MSEVNRYWNDEMYIPTVDGTQSYEALNEDTQFVLSSDYDALAVEVRSWRILVNGDENKPFKVER